MSFRTERLGVDAGLMSFIQDTKRKTFRDDCWHVATKVPTKPGYHYVVTAEMTDNTDGWGIRCHRLRIHRVESDGNFIIEDGCKYLIISDPCYILPNKTWGDFCNKLEEGERKKPYPIFIDHNGVKVAVSSSGFGDGYYACNIEMDDGGDLKEAYVTFFTPGEDEEDLDESMEGGADV